MRRSFAMRTRILLLCLAALMVFAQGALADTAQSYPFLTRLLPGNETPPITDTSSANVVVWVHVVRDSGGNITSGSVDFNVNCKFSGTSKVVTGLHIHNAPAGTAGNIVVPTDVNATTNSIAIDSSGAVSAVKQVQFPQNPSVTVATIADLLVNPQNYYVNVHTDDHPGGAMRGQLIPAQQRVLIGLMKPGNEVPPVASNGTAVGTVTVLRAQDSTGTTALAHVTFSVDYTGFDAKVFTGLHIHRGDSTVAGPVIINTGINGSTNSVPVSSTGNGNLSYEVPITPADASFANEVSVVNGLFDNPAG